MKSWLISGGCSTGAAYPHKIRSATPLLIAAAVLLTVVPLRAERECENPSYGPVVQDGFPAGTCAHLPNADIFYYDTGWKDDSLREAIIFAHAGTGNADAFKYQLNHFAALGYRVISYDRKNVNRSSNSSIDASKGRPLGRTVDDLDALATHLGLNNFHLVGVAAGGQVAVQYAFWNPSRVLSMVLAATLGPPGLGANAPDLAAFTANITMPFEVLCPVSPIPAAVIPPLRAVAAATTAIPQVSAEHRELGASFRGSNREGVEFYLQIEEHSRHRTFDGCRFTNIGENQPGLATDDPSNPNTYERLSRVKPRTLIMAGGGDILSPPYGMRLWGSKMATARAQWLMLGDAGHAIQIEDPDGFNQAVLRFLRGSEPFEPLN